MTPEHGSLVQQSFGRVVPIASQAAALFYGRLFELDPALRALFKNDLAEQGSKLMQMLAYCVARLDEPEQLLPAVHELGRKHAAYGVTDKDYETVGRALLWTLEKGLGPAFTPPVREAWVAAYTLLATAMKKGAGTDAA